MKILEKLQLVTEMITQPGVYTILTLKVITKLLQ